MLERPGTEPVKGTVIASEGRPATLSLNDVSVQIIPTAESERVVKIRAETWEKTVGNNCDLSRDCLEYSTIKEDLEHCRLCGDSIKLTEILFLLNLGIKYVFSQILSFVTFVLTASQSE